ncbi:MAG TPA: GntR family transcriptional regulator [Solirubrobacterales bacterium]|nr:GntR family transcriptional regulator [Solirubrobacterales bacterium]
MPRRGPADPAPTSGIRPVERPKSLTETAHEAIRAAIRDGRFEPETLYSESELAVSLGISRTPVREAMIELSREGLVEVLPRHGFRLRTLSAADREEVFALRLAIETLAAETLARSAGREEIADLRRCLERQRRLRDDVPAFLAADEALHLLIPELAGLTRTRSVLLALRGSVWLIAHLALTLPERVDEVLAEHEAIVAAIAAGDPTAAAAAVRAHLETTLAASTVSS